MISAVLFDLDGTLMDHRAATTWAIVRWLNRAVPGLSSQRVELLAQRWSEIELQHMDSYLAGECTFAEQRRRRLRQFLPETGLNPLTEAEADSWFDSYLRSYESRWRPYPDVIPALSRLSRGRAATRLAVLTNGDAQQQEAKVDACRLRSLFCQVMSSESRGVAKPASDCFEIACRSLGVSPEQCAYVGDSVESDARPARAAGLHAVWLDRLESDMDGFQPRISSLVALPELVAQLRCSQRRCDGRRTSAPIGRDVTVRR